MKLMHPWLLLLLLVNIPLIYFYIAGLRKANPYITVSTLKSFKVRSGGYKVWLLHLCFIFKLLAISFVIVALCRPQTHDALSNSAIEGTDIVLALDISASMETPDMTPTRFDAATKMASAFVEKRDHDNMGLVAFAGESLTFMPLTTDRTSVLNAISHLQLGALGNGTAIGDGLVNAINRVLGGKAVSKSVILLTDGSNNAGEVDPITAAQIAKQKNVRVYTIAVGKPGSVPVSSFYGNITTNVPIEIDEETLQKIAETTEGKFFRARDTRSLQQVFDEIDKLERSKINVDNFKRTDDHFMPWIGAALILFCLQLILRLTLLRRIP